MSALSPQEALALLKTEEPPQRSVQQFGPLRWFDREMSCASRGCRASTYSKVEGVPYCMMHALRRLNEMLAERGVDA